MSEVTRWVMTICSGVLICGLISVLIPNASMEKGMNLVLGLFLLCCFLLPMGIDFSDFQLDLGSPEEIRGDVAERTTDYFLSSALALSEEEITSIISKELVKHGIKEDEFLIYIGTEEASPEGEMEIVVTLYLPGRIKDSHDIIYKALEYELGLTVRLEYVEEET